MNALVHDARIAGDLGKGTPLHALFRGRNGVIAAYIIGFIVFLPYPAISAGGNTGIQLGDVFSLLFALPLVFLSWKRNPYYLFGLILFPLVLSCLKVAIMREPGVDTALKTSLSTGIWCVTLLTAQLFIPTFFMEVMCGVAAATLLHALVGAWQMYVFQTGGELPLQFLYVNPSFYSVQDYSETIVKYIQRPFGLFSEPSAMSSSLAPFVLLWLAEMLGLVKYVRTPKRWQRILFAAAAISGLLLIIASRSGHAMATLGFACVLGLAWLKTARATWRNYLSILTVLMVVLPFAVWMTYLAVGARVTEINGANESWQERSYSLVLGFDLWIHSDIWTILFGMGGSQSAVATSNSSAHIEAVYSVLLSYIYDNGVVSIIVVGWIGRFLYKIWQSTRFSVTYASIFLIWFIGITVITSYNMLLPIWFALGLLTVWPMVITQASVRRRPSKNALRNRWVTRVPSNIRVAPVKVGTGDIVANTGNPPGIGTP